MLNLGTLRTYYWLTKPGIIYGNLVAAAAGFLLASAGVIRVDLFLSAMFGLGFIIASACVLNNYIDRDIDEKMVRTKKRALVTGTISGKNALMYAVVLNGIGVSLLTFYTNLLTVFVALLGFFFYVVVYGIYKRQSVWGTVVGSISGAVPPVVGYLAVTNRFDTAALILFLILVFWQMPHFYAIAMYRLKDYKAASIPVLPVVEGMHITKIYILFYIAAFIIASSMLTVTGYTGYIYLLVVGLLGLMWLGLGIQGFKTTNNAAWARKMFSFSLLVLLGLCAMLSVDALLL